MRNAMIFFARHGETQNGKEKRFEGVLNSPLTDVGKRQAKELAEFCLQNNIQKIYSSPLTRARQTAEYASTKLKIPVIVKDELKEICYGEFEGRTREKLEKLPVWDMRKKDFFNFVHPGSCLGIPGESYSMLYERLIPFFKSLAEETEPVVVVSHVGVVRCAKKFYDHKTDEELKRLQIGNGEALSFPLSVE